jgi:hypothetical protein
VAFFATYAGWRSPVPLTLGLGGVAVLITAWDRLRQKEHDVTQVIGGIVSGVTFGLVFCAGWLDKFHGRLKMERYCVSTSVAERSVVATMVGVLGVMLVTRMGRILAGGGGQHDTRG